MTPMMTFWATALGFSLLLYIVLDGFDLGIGILFPFAPDEPCRQHMMEAVAPVWDGNETWLIISAATLFAAFPEAYAILLSAFYLPVIVMLCGLILRGVAFEFRSRTTRFRWIWSVSFSLGSLAAAFAQGSAIGAFVQQVPVHDGVFTGSVLSWLSPFAILCGFGLCLGYAMLGSAWLVLKTEGEARRFGYRAVAIALAGVMVFLAASAVSVFALHLRVADQWRQRPVLFVCLGIGSLAFIVMLLALLRAGSLPLSHGGGHVRCRVLYDGAGGAAVHRTVFGDARRGCGAAQQPFLPVLGRRTLRAATHRHLHRRGLLHFPRQDRARRVTGTGRRQCGSGSLIRTGRGVAGALSRARPAFVIVSSIITSEKAAPLPERD